MNGFKKVLAAVALTAVAVNAAQVQNLFADPRAVRVDDILTIIIVESAKAGSESKTNTSKATDVEFNAGSSKFIPPMAFGAGNSSKYDGKGATSRSGSLSATVTARVIKVLDGGNLVIEGSKTVEINQEKEIIKISGVVRPQDIQKNNIVYSTSIADAEITYTGKGTVNTASRPGFFTRVANWLF
ncbi:MAG: flagellar basal body L-ring protein FlgH [Chitinispirillales bacterium]|jgi:flagellar L-ring protein precursor FlgH|nr:flagellar basal body L-ring protein FlgH [Chitinispirillales bacterium]